MSDNSSAWAAVAKASMAAAEMKDFFMSPPINAAPTIAANRPVTESQTRTVRPRYWLFVNVEGTIIAFPEHVAFVQHNGTAANRCLSPRLFRNALYLQRPRVATRRAGSAVTAIRAQERCGSGSLQSRVRCRQRPVDWGRSATAYRL